MTLRSSAVAGATALLVWGCGQSQVAGNGNSGTQTTNVLSVTMLTPDGVPAAFAQSRIRSATYLSPSLLSLDSSWHRADSAGRVTFVLDSTSCDSVMVESRWVSQTEQAFGAVALTSCAVEGDSCRHTARLDTLRSLYGSVELGQGPSLVRIRGLERYVIPDDDGKFQVDSLPAGSFRLVVESRSHRGLVELQAESGDTLPTIQLGEAAGFLVEDFESFDGVTMLGDILGDGWWTTFTTDTDHERAILSDVELDILSGNEDCISGNCLYLRSGTFIPELDDALSISFKVGQPSRCYSLPLETLFFSGKGQGTLKIIVTGENSDGDSADWNSEVQLDEEWQAFAVARHDLQGPVGDMCIQKVRFTIAKQNYLLLDDVAFGGVTTDNVEDLR